MTPTRRGFLGSLAALGATLVAPIARPATIQKQPTNKQEDRDDDPETKSCITELFTREGEAHKMMSRYSVVWHSGSGTIHVECGEVYFKGTIFTGKLYGVDFLPEGSPIEIGRDAYVTIGDSVSLDMGIDLT